MIDPVQNAARKASSGLLKLMVSSGKEKEKKLITLVRKLPGWGVVIAHDSDSAAHITDTLDNALVKSVPYFIEDDPDDDMSGFSLSEGIRVAVTEPAALYTLPRNKFRFVIHWMVPPSADDYISQVDYCLQQDIESFAILLFEPDDRYLLEENISKRYSGSSSEFRKAAENIENMAGYVISDRCRMLYLTGQEGYEQPCGNCDICRKTRTGQVTDKVKQEDVRILLKCIAETREKFGVNVLSGVLKGTLSGKAADYGLDRASTFGKMRDRRRNEIKAMFSELLECGLLRRTRGTYSSLYITQPGRQMLGPVRIDQLELPKQVKGAEISGVDTGLIEILRNFRREQARMLDLQAFMLFNDAVLQRIAAEKPVTKEDLMQIRGFGTVKWDLIGEALLIILRRYTSAK